MPSETLKQINDHDYVIIPKERPAKKDNKEAKKNIVEKLFDDAAILAFRILEEQGVYFVNLDGLELNEDEAKTAIRYCSDIDAMINERLARDFPDISERCGYYSDISNVPPGFYFVFVKKA